MIYIDVSKNKSEILDKHFEDIRKSSSVVKHFSMLQKYPILYGWLVKEEITRKGPKSSINDEIVKPLICAQTKAQLIDQIEQMEFIFLLDSQLTGDTIDTIRGLTYEAFNNCYDNFSNRKWAFEFLNMLGNDVCPYCNRTFTMSVYKNNSKQKPDFDHFFPKRKYPYLAISIMNLVPICSNCNRGKGDDYVNAIKQTVCYPYEEEFGDEIKFTTDFEKIESWFTDDEEFKIVLEGGSQEIRDTYNKAFKIDDLYTMHKDYIKDLLKKSILVSDEFLIGIYSSFPELFSSLKEVKELVYGNYLDKENYSKRPLAKMINDVLDEIKND